MTHILVLFAGAGGNVPSWAQIADDLVIARGEGYPAVDDDHKPVVVLVAPADIVTLHPATLAGFAPAQAHAAGILIAAEASIAPIDTLHVVSGDGVAVIARTQMVDLLAKAQAHGFDPDVVIPAPLMLPQPEKGFVRGHVGGEWVVRGGGTGFVDDPSVTPLLTFGGDILTLDDGAVTRMLIAALATPAINLRQGLFARQRDWSFDRTNLYRLARIAAVIGVLALLIPLVMIIRLNQDSRALELKAGALAKAAVGGNVRAEEAESRLDAKLFNLRGGGGGFIASAAASSAALKQIGNTELSSMSFADDGALRIGARASTPAELTALQRQIEAGGFKVVMGPPSSIQGQPVAELQVIGR